MAAEDYLNIKVNQQTLRPHIYSTQNSNYEYDDVNQYYNDVYDYFPSANRTYNAYTGMYNIDANVNGKRKGRRPKRRKSRRNSNSSTTNAIITYRKIYNNRTRDNKSLSENFNIIGKHGDSIFSSCKGLSEGFGRIATLAIIAIGALLSIRSYLDIKNSSFNPEYAPEGYTNMSKYSGLSTGKVSEQMKNQIKSDEGGFKERAYWDKDGYSIGYGHHGLVNGKPIYEGQIITKEQADALFEQDISVAENRVKNQLKKAGITTPISQNMFDAMVNYVYNAGSLGPKFLAKLKAGDYQGATQELEVGNENLARMARIRQLFSSDIDATNKLKMEVQSINLVTPTEEVTRAGEIAQFRNGAKIGEYVMSNPNQKRHYIELSERAQAFLEETGGKGRITSGAEGDTHVRGTGMTHMAGNKIDVAAYNSTDWNEWADIAIPFIKNPHTAFITFEGFRKWEYDKIEPIIFSKIDDALKRKCLSKVSHGWGTLGKRFLNYADAPKYIKNGKHLDIGIKLDAYSKKENKTVIKEEEQSANKQRLTDGQNILANTSNNKPTTAKESSGGDVKGKDNAKNSPILITPQSKTNGGQSQGGASKGNIIGSKNVNVGKKSIVEQIRDANRNYVKGRN